MRPVVPVLVVLLLVCLAATGLYLVFDGFSGAGATGTGTTDTAQHGPTSPQTGSAGGTSDPAAAGDIARSELRQRSGKGHRVLVQVTVVAKDTCRPVPGARVHYLSSGQDRSEIDRLDPEERERLASDRETYNRRFGETAIADSNGIVEVSFSGGWVQLVGRHGQLFGQLTIGKNVFKPPQGWLLWLEQDSSLTVQVVDHQGRPADGVAIALQSCKGEFDDDLADDAAVVAWSKSDGTAVVPHVQLQHRYWATDGKLPPLLRVIPAIPGLLQGGVAFDPTNLPKEPVRLVLPMTGRIVLQVADARQRPLPGRFETMLDVATDALQRGWEYELPGPRCLLWAGRSAGPGRTVFPHVVCERRYAARAEVQGSVSARVFPGPVFPGQEVPVVLGLDPEVVLVTLRAVDEAGQPLARKKLRLTIDSSVFSANDDFDTDERGRLLVVLGKSDSGIRIQSGKLKLRRDDGVILVGTLRTDQELSPGRNDLGDVVLTRQRLTLVAGRLVVGEQPPREQVAMTVERRDGAPGAEANGWRTWRDASVRIDKNGQFQVQGEFRTGDYRLRVYSFAYLPVQPVEFVPGKQGLEIALREGGQLEAVVLTDPGIPPSGLELRLRRPEQPGPPERSGTETTEPLFFDPLLATPVVKQDVRKVYRWHRVEPAVYDLVVRTPGSAPLVTIHSVRVEAGQPRTPDPRLAEIDLRKWLRRIRLDIVGPEGAPLRQESGEGLLLVERSDDRHELDPVLIVNGTATLVTGAADLGVLVLAPGYVPETVRGIAADREIQLRRAPNVTLRLRDGLPALPAGMSLRLGLRLARPDSRSYVLFGQRRKLAERMGSTLSTADVDPQGKASLRVPAPGSYLVTARVHSVGGQTVAVEGVTPAAIEVSGNPSAQPLEITIPREGLQGALEIHARRGGR